MKLKELADIFSAKRIGICADDEQHVVYFDRNPGWGSDNAIKRACIKYGDREVTLIWPADGSEAIISVA